MKHLPYLSFKSNILVQLHDHETNYLQSVRLVSSCDTFRTRKNVYLLFIEIQFFDMNVSEVTTCTGEKRLDWTEMGETPSLNIYTTTTSISSSVEQLK